MAGGNNTMHFLSQLEDGSFMKEFEYRVHDADVNCIRWNPVQPTVFVTCGDDGVVKVWEIYFHVCFDRI